MVCLSVCRPSVWRSFGRSCSPSFVSVSLSVGRSGLPVRVSADRSVCSAVRLTVRALVCRSVGCRSAGFSARMFVCLSAVCLLVSRSGCRSVGPFVGLRACRSGSICRPGWPFVLLLVPPSFHGCLSSVCLLLGPAGRSAYLLVWLLVCLPVRMYVCLAVRRSVGLSASPYRLPVRRSVRRSVTLSFVGLSGLCVVDRSAVYRAFGSLFAGQLAVRLSFRPSVCGFLGCCSVCRRPGSPTVGLAARLVGWLPVSRLFGGLSVCLLGWPSGFVAACRSPACWFVGLSVGC